MIDRHARQDVDQQGVVLGEAHRLPQHRAVVEDDVDADELLEDGQHDPGPDDRADPRVVLSSRSESLGL
jgi:hypothetical protein